MDKRMHAIASYIEPGLGFIDVGTDHGYLPAWMARHGYPGNIFATDIKAKPLERAVRTAEKAGVSGQIKFQLCDGLAGCPPAAIDTIVIAGMGGDSICRILDMAEWCMDSRYKLILQPMTKAEILRYWLVNNEFELFVEDKILEGGTIYPLILARFGGCTRLSDGELFLGKRNLCPAPALYEQQRQKLILRFSAAIAGMEKDASPGGAHSLKLYREILSELKDMR